ncbi:MAG: hypothetical protein HY905_17335 [Deltaproteobacteria bacterium]|nr:hypothetical protein [Deltaproteobacteria bacterium]
MKRIAWIGGVVLLFAGSASATTTTFNGTAGADTMLVGRGYDGGGNLIYLACVNGSWAEGNLVTGSSDTVTTNGNGGIDTITVRSSSGIYDCGVGGGKWLHSMNYVYSCPNVYVNGGTGNDRIIGAQCAEHLNGDDGNDTIFGNAGNDWIYAGADNDCISDTTLTFLSCGSGTDSYTDDLAWKDCENQVGYCLLPP